MGYAVQVRTVTLNIPEKRPHERARLLRPATLGALPLLISHELVDVHPDVEE